MKRMTSLALWISVPLVFSGCAMLNGPGDKPSDTAPRIITDSSKNSLWDNPRLFGPVPADKQEVGDAVCKQAGLQKATGYHPKAENAEGKPFKTGGYLCV